MNSTFISAVSGCFWLLSFVTLSVTSFVTLVTVLIFRGFIVQYPFSCLRRFELDEKRALHSSHSYGFSPVCTRSWLFRSVFKMNFFGQKLHWNGFSPVCLNTDSSRHESEQCNKIQNWVTVMLVTTLCCWLYDGNNNVGDSKLSQTSMYPQMRVRHSIQRVNTKVSQSWLCLS